MLNKLLGCLLALAFAAPGLATELIRYQPGLIAISGVTVIDGTGSPGRVNQTLVMKQDRILALGPMDDVKVPQGATVIDGRGKTLLPGLVMMHEHMFYPMGQGHYTEMLRSFPRLYVAGGATTVRTAGTMSPYGDLGLGQAIARDEVIGPDMDVTAPYLNGPGLPILKVHALKDVPETQAMVAYWAKEGITSYKAYMHISRAQLGEAIRMAHQQGQTVTAHLCSVTYREAAELGIDNLEHGFLAATDFVQDKEADVCPSGEAMKQSLLDLDIDGPEATALIRTLVDKKVALTSTLTVYETFTRGRPQAYPEALEVLLPQIREQYRRRWQSISESDDDTWPRLFRKAMALEKKFVEAGGTLMVGTDPTGYGGVIAGFANQRALELLVEAGFSVEQTVNFATLNGARFLGRDREVGSLAVGKRADLVLVDGELTEDIRHIRTMPLVFKKGVGYDTQALITSMKSVVGLY